MKDGSIRVHPKYGLNPTVLQCYVCGEDKGVALLGAAYKGEAPRTMCVDKEPCDKCKEYMKQGSILIEVRDGEKGEDPFRTGGFWVLKKEAAERLGITAPVAFIQQTIAWSIGLGGETDEGGKEE